MRDKERNKHFYYWSRMQKCNLKVAYIVTFIMEKMLMKIKRVQHIPKCIVPKNPETALKHELTCKREMSSKLKTMYCSHSHVEVRREK